MSACQTDMLVGAVVEVNMQNHQWMDYLLFRTVPLLDPFKCATELITMDPSFQFLKVYYVFIW